MVSKLLLVGVFLVFGQRPKAQEVFFAFVKQKSSFATQEMNKQIESISNSVTEFYRMYRRTVFLGGIVDKMIES